MIPALRMVERLIEERKPKLVVTIGLGAGVVDAHRPGDVVVATQARFELPDGFRTAMDDYGQTFGNALTIDQSWFSPLDEVEDLPLRAASNYYQSEVIWPEPRTYRPKVLVEGDKPVITRPSLTGPSFLPAGTKTMWQFDRKSKGWLRGPNADYLGDVAAAIDMDSAVVARQCQKASPDVQFVAVIGVCMPTLDAQPFAPQVRPAWAQTYQRQFGAKAATNAVTAATTLIDHLNGVA
jgi:hypothetical protein